MKRGVFAAVRIPVSESESLELAPLSLEHADGCLRACQDERVQRWLPLPNPYTREIAEAWCGAQAEEFRRAGQGIHFAVLCRGQFQGSISLKNVRWLESTIEIGYWLGPWARGNGYMTDAVRSLTRHALGLGFERIELRIATGNASSLRVAEVAGYTFEGVLRQAGYVHAGQVDLAMYSFIARDLTN